MSESDWDHSYFSFWRSPSKVQVHGEQIMPENYNLMTFLATAQSLKVPLLPMMWDTAGDLTGAGATSRIQDLTVDLETSFAFKIFHKGINDEHQVYHTLMNEMLVLSQDPIQQHENIARLHGICWDISPHDDKPWPVLVFEKSHFGDLQQFAKHEGKSLGFPERFQLCTGIGRALSDMHANGIIHGDIKPENVLIFQNSSGQHYARLTDFGYSARYLNGEQRLSLFGTELWNAPEHDSPARRWALTEAIRADLFSFGMLCLWVLFEPSLSSPSAFIMEDLGWAGMDTPTSALDALRRLKHANQLSEFAQKAIILEITPDLEQKKSLARFFQSSLDFTNPEQREESLPILLSGSHCAREYQKVILPTADMASSKPSCFRIDKAIYDLYRSDYRLRLEIAKSLLLSYDQSHEIAIQAALCCYIGFGVTRNVAECERILLETGQSRTDINSVIAGIREESNIFDSAILTSVLYSQDFAYTYMAQGKVETARQHLGQEMDGLAQAFGDNHTLTTLLKYILAQVYLLHHPLDLTQGRDMSHNSEQLDGIKASKTAEKLLFEVMETSKRNLKAGDPETLFIMSNFSTVFASRGQWNDAEKIVLEILELAKAYFDPYHQTIVAVKVDLALIYAMTGRLQERESLLAEIIETSTSSTRGYHQGVISAKINLSWLYHEQKRWKDLEKLELKWIEMVRVRRGEGDTNYIQAVASLAETYQELDRLEEAETLLLDAAQSSRKRMGMKNLATISCFNKLKVLYWNTERYGEVESLLLEAIGAQKALLGVGHPDTMANQVVLASAVWRQGRKEEAERLEAKIVENCELHMKGPRINVVNSLKAMSALAKEFWDQDRLEESVKLEYEVVDIQKSKLGVENPYTLLSMADLAWTYQRLERWAEAESLHREIIEAKSNTFGSDDLDTLSSIESLAHMQHDRGHLEAAEHLYYQVLEKTTAVRGEGHTDTLRRQESLALLYGEQGRWKEAGDLFTRLVEKRTATLGEGHPDTRVSMYNLGVNLKSQGLDEAALEYMKKCAESYRKVLENDHPDIILVLETLQEWCPDGLSTASL